MRITLLVLLIALLLPAAGCTTRSDKEKNKDYDKPKAVKKDER